MRIRPSQPRALVVAYDFPPHGAIGTMRTLRVVQRLAAEGWDVRVLTGDPQTFRPGTPTDDALLRRVPPSVRVLRAPAFRGFERLKGLIRKPAHCKGGTNGVTGETPTTVSTSRSLPGRALDVVDAALAIPDNESAWFLPAVMHGFWTCRRWRPDVLYSSAPPWTGQLVARALATILRCPWVADFRDPWARAPWREARREFIRRANGVLERAVVRRADAVVFVTRGNLEEFSTFYGPEASRRFHLVPNGCDPSEFEDLAETSKSDRFVLLHAGSLYGARNPLPLVHAIANAIAHGAIERDRFRLRLVGPINLNVDLRAECQRLGMEDVVEFVPRVSRSESLREMTKASALLLVQPVTTVSVPGKAYEYLAAGRPLLALAEEGETAELVRASGIGVSIQPDAGLVGLERTLLDVIDIASKPYVAAPSALYDGRVHAAATVALLAQLCEHGARIRQTVSVGASAHVSASAHVEEPPR